MQRQRCIRSMECPMVTAARSLRCTIRQLQLHRCTTQPRPSILTTLSFSSNNNLDISVELRILEFSTAEVAEFTTTRTRTRDRKPSRQILRPRLQTTVQRERTTNNSVGSTRSLTCSVATTSRVTEFRRISQKEISTKSRDRTCSHSSTSRRTLWELLYINTSLLLCLTLDIILTTTTTITKTPNLALQDSGMQHHTTSLLQTATTFTPQLQGTSTILKHRPTMMMQLSTLMENRATNPSPNR
mmetsp:Transcript_14485/g.26047  ORF Transcript_14485/g.26047 Transcript_14485/m.26047 type:complete len:243 (-) Transcript_14485:717-1445(-)